MQSRRNRNSNSTSNNSNNSNSNKRSNHKSKKSFRGGRTEIVSPEIVYTKGSNTNPIKLMCTKCNGIKFIVKTLTMGTKTKSFFNMEILDNRFKVFQCAGCGFAQMFSNEITCNGKDCDPKLF